MSRTRYLDDERLTPPEIAIGWTGPAVVNDSITAEDARARAAALRGRAPLIWDNYPVNGATMADRLHLGPLWGRDNDLLEACSGYLANPMVQPRCSRLPLASIAAWLRGDDPLTAWVEEAGALRVFAEACDGQVPGAWRPTSRRRPTVPSGRPRPGRWLSGSPPPRLARPRVGGGGRRLAAAGPPRGSPRVGRAPAHPGRSAGRHRRRQRRRSDHLRPRPTPSSPRPSSSAAAGRRSDAASTP